MNAKAALKGKKTLRLWLINVPSLRRRVLALLMCLFIAIDVLQKKYENSRFLKFNLSQERVGGWMQMEKFALALPLTAPGREFQRSGLVAIDDGHNISLNRFRIDHLWLYVQASKWVTH